MKGDNISVVYWKELTDSLRDRRAVISMIVVPIVLMPLITVGAGLLTAVLVGTAMQETPEVMVLGGEDSPRVLAALREFDEVTIMPARPDYAARIADQQIRAAVEIPPGFDDALQRGETADVKIYMYEGDLRSSFAADRLRTFFTDLRERTVRERLEAHRLPANLVQPFAITQTNVAPPEKVGGSLFGGIVPYFVILLALTGAMYPALDLTVGEKERGTIETILCSPISRTHLVLGKFLMVLTASLLTAALAVASMGITFAATKQMLTAATPLPVSVPQISISVSAVASVFLLVVPLAVLFSAALMAIALFARSYKEAQSYVSPLTIIVALPALAAVLPGLELNAALSLIPVLNVSLVSKEIVTGIYDWGHIGIILASSCVYAAAALWTSVRLFQREDVLFRS